MRVSVCVNAMQRYFFSSCKILKVLIKDPKLSFFPDHKTCWTIRCTKNLKGNI